MPALNFNLNNLSAATEKPNVIMAFARTGEFLPDTIKERWQASFPHPSPVVTICDSLEPMYAAMKLVPEATAAIMPVLAAAAFVISANGFHDLQDRAGAIYQACRRANGEDVPGEDPEVDKAYLPQPEPEAPAIDPAA